IPRLPQDAILCPVLERDLDDEPGLHPVPDFPGALVGMTVERTFLLFELLHPRVPLATFTGAESTTDASHVAQALARLHAHEQRGKRAGAAPGQEGGAADHELLLAVALDL